MVDVVFFKEMSRFHPNAWAGSHVRKRKKLLLYRDIERHHSETLPKKTKQAAVISV
jgi:hypothetical protein